MAQLLERIDSFITLSGGGDQTLWAPASGELGILCFFWVHALSQSNIVTIKTSSITFFKFNNDVTNPALPISGGAVSFDSTLNFDPTHMGQFKFPIEGAVDNLNPLLINLVGENIVYSLAVVKET